MINSVCLIKKNVKASVLESSFSEYFWRDHLFFSYFYGNLLDCAFLKSPKDSFGQWNQLPEFPSFHGSSFPGMPLTVLLEALVPLGTDVIVFCMQILAKIFREGLCCTVMSLRCCQHMNFSVITCPNFKKFPVLYFLFFPRLFLSWGVKWLTLFNIHVN